MLLGLLLGSSVAITFSLSVVAFVFWLLQERYPRLEAELQPLLVNLAIFLVLTVVAAVSFYGEAKRAPWRYVSSVALALMVLAVGRYYWPESGA